MTAASSVSTGSTSGNYKFLPKSSKSSRFSTATTTTTSKYSSHDDDEFSTLLKVYRKAFKEKVHQHDTMTAHNPSPSPVPSYASKSVMFLQSRHTDKGSYVQRWKALRNRNQNLPKLDWNSKAAGRAHQGNNGKKYSKLPANYSRSHTYDSTQFPSLSKASVITKYSGGNRSVYSDNYRNDRQKDKDKDRNDNLQEQSESYKEIKGKKEVYNALSKALPNIAADNSDVTLSIGGTATGATKVMYEKISRQKILSDRFHGTKEKDKNYANKTSDQAVQTKQGENEQNHVHSTDKEKGQSTGNINPEEKQTLLYKISREGSKSEISELVEIKDHSFNKDGTTVAGQFLELKKSDEFTSAETPNCLSTTN